MRSPVARLTGSASRGHDGSRYAGSIALLDRPQTNGLPCDYPTAYNGRRAIDTFYGELNKLLLFWLKDGASARFIFSPHGRAAAAFSASGPCSAFARTG